MACGGAISCYSADRGRAGSWNIQWADRTRGCYFRDEGGTTAGGVLFWYGGWVGDCAESD